MASSICLASFLRSGAIDFGIAQPQISSQANGLVRFGPSGKRVAATLPALRQWKAGTMSDEAFWRRCLFDPPEGFGMAANQ